MAGVLVALAVNAWWQGRQERQVEIAYLQQLHVDLQASSQTLADTHALIEGMTRASASVLHQFWRPGQRSDGDLRKLMAEPLRSRRVLPVLGTARSLIASGDLRLIQSTSLRSAIPRYVDAMDAYVSDVARYDETYYQPGVRDVAELFDGSALVAGADLPRDRDYSTYSRPDSTAQPPFPVDLQMLLKDEAVYRAYSKLLIGHRGQANQYRAMQKATAELQAEVTAALASLQR
ncbi:hypothetical protein GCM10010080_03420 [Thermomonas carbonis]|nr:hypothetical protein GCM10010080_03420 [Thermomonas carbonis]